MNGKKYKIVLIGNTSDFTIANALLKRFEIIAGVVDERASNRQRQRQYLRENAIQELSFDEAMNLNTDCYLILFYSKLIDKKYLGTKKILNLHGGVLPKYRGFSSNLIALLNNEKSLGYTLHIIDEGMDSGDILATFEVENDLDSMVEDLIAKIKDKVVAQMPNIIQKYLDGKLIPTPQEHKFCVYSTSLRASDGEIRDWNQPSSHIYNLFRIFGGQNGSGVYFWHKGQRYQITKMSMRKEVAKYMGIAGAVVFIGGGGNSLWIKTKDTVICIDEVRLDGKIVSNFVKIGTRLG